MTPYEALLAQGFPVLPSLCHGLRLTSFSKDLSAEDAAPQAEAAGADARPPVDLWRACPDHGRTARIGQAGNAMHSEIVGLVILYVLSKGGAADPQATTRPNNAGQSRAGMCVVSGPLQRLAAVIRG